MHCDYVRYSQQVIKNIGGASTVSIILSWLVSNQKILYINVIPLKWQKFGIETHIYYVNVIF